MLNDTQSRVTKLVSRFQSDLVALASEIASQTIRDALVVNGNGHSNGHARGGSQKGQKRDPAVIAETGKRFVAFVAKHPGLRIEQINKQLGTTTKDLALPIRKLLADKAIKIKGQKRSTTYFVK